MYQDNEGEWSLAVTRTWSAVVSGIRISQSMCRRSTRRPGRLPPASQARYPASRVWRYNVLRLDLWRIAGCCGEGPELHEQLP